MIKEWCYPEDEDSIEKTKKPVPCNSRGRAYNPWYHLNSVYVNAYPHSGTSLCPIAITDATGDAYLEKLFNTLLSGGIRKVFDAGSHHVRLAVREYLFRTGSRSLHLSRLYAFALNLSSVNFYGRLPDRGFYTIIKVFSMEKNPHRGKCRGSLAKGEKE